jgi:hypothetical protein
MVQTGCGRGSRAPRRRRLVVGLAGLAALVVAGAACSSSGAAAASALPKPDAPMIGVALDANVMSPSDLSTFDDTNGHGAVPAGGRYQVGVRGAQSVVTSTLDPTFPVDQIVSATFDTTGSPNDTGFGVICRMQDDDDYYRLGVGNDGEFAIQRVKGGTTTVLTGGGKWAPGPGIRKTPGLFTVRAECIGTTLTLFESNRAVATVNDPQLSGGKVGVFVETFYKPKAVIQVNSLAVRAFNDRRRVPDAAAMLWGAAVDAQHVSRRCALLDPKQAEAPAGTAFVTRCGSVLFLQGATPARATSELDRILHASGTRLTAVKALPSCPKRTGIRGPLPPPAAGAGAAGAASIGRVACLDLGDRTAVVWAHDPGGVVGVTRIDASHRAAWRGYGADWPPFASSNPPS